MLDPFTYWSRAMSAALDLGRTGVRTAETMKASGDVIASRSDTMRDAIGSPVTADYGEIMRMVPEKVDAFSKVGVAVMGEWWAMQGAWMVEAQHVGAMMLRGRPPTYAEMSALSSRGAAYGLRSMEAGAKLGRVALAPIHKAATGNARRLGKRRAS